MKKDEDITAFTTIDEWEASLYKMSTWDRITTPFYRLKHFLISIPTLLRVRFCYKLYKVVMPRLSKWGYYETPDRILHANMELLTQFVDHQKPLEAFDWEHYQDKKVRDDYTKILKVYNFWKDHPRRQKEIEDLYDEWTSCEKPSKDYSTKMFERVSELNVKLHKEEVEMLHLVIDLKDSLWT
jgi:hypothetical protein